MFQKLEVFRLSQALAGHSAARQAVIAQNLAHADTPGYRAKDIGPFSAAVSTGGPRLAMRQTRDGHLALGNHDIADAKAQSAVSASPNGNSVNIETELLKAAEIEQDHDRALAIYRSSLSILRLSLGRR